MFYFVEVLSVAKNVLFLVITFCGKRKHLLANLKLDVDVTLVEAFFENFV